jgi:hypothetical protein
MATSLARTHYERAVLRDARAAFDNPFRTPVSAFAYAVERRGSKRHGARALARPSEPTPELALAAAGLLAASDVALRTLRPRAVWAAYRREGWRHVQSAEDVRRLALWEVDEITDDLRKRYMLVGAATGALAGRAGPLPLVLDVPVLTGLALRAIGDYALHYGFDIDAPEERAYAMKILIASVVPGITVDTARLEDLARVSDAAARVWRRCRRALSGLPFAVQLARRFVRGANARILKRVLAVAAGAASAWFMLGVAETAQSAYRRRFLARTARAPRALEVGIDAGALAGAGGR